MNLAIRVDVGGARGYGHAKRMLGLARALQAQDPGGWIEFLTTTAALKPLVAPFMASVYRPEDRAHDILLTSQAARESDVLVVDTKADWPPDLWPALRRRYRVVRVDHPVAEPETCDLLLIPNCHQAPETVARLSEDFEGRLLYGAPYVLLDADIQTWQSYRWAGWAANRLVFLAGGVDPASALQQFLDRSEGLVSRLASVWLVYVVGAGQAHALTVRGLAANQAIVGFRPSFLLGAALWVGLFGVTPYQALHLGIPMVTVGHTVEATEGSRWLMEQSGATLDLGFLGTLDRAVFADALVELWHDTVTRGRMSALGRQLIDGKGAQRCAEAILALGRG